MFWCLLGIYYFVMGNIKNIWNIRTDARIPTIVITVNSINGRIGFPVYVTYWLTKTIIFIPCKSCVFLSFYLRKREKQLYCKVKGRLYKKKYYLQKLRYSPGWLCPLVFWERILLCIESIVPHRHCQAQCL